MNTKLNKLTKYIQQLPAKLRWVVMVFLAIMLTLPTSLYSVAHAVTQNPTPAARITFTFDDGLASAATQALPTLSKYGLTGTDYVITGCVGMTTIPNTCHANTDARYMTWAQIKQLQSAGWEIGSHTATHPYLASSDATDGQPNVLTPAQVATELSKSKADLAAQGITSNAFSTPYGDYTSATLAQIAKFYTSHRGFADQNNNNWPLNDYLINDMQVQAGVTVAQVKAKIDAAITNKQWLVLTMHDIKTRASTNPDDYEYSTANLDSIAAYVKSKQTAGLIQPVNISGGLVTSDVNLLANSTFDNGIADGWTTDDAANIIKDTGDNGSFPSSTNAIKFTAGTTKNTHLFSPKVTIDPNATYMLKNFVNVTKVTSGELGFFIDEYDSAGNWVSGQYKNGERTAFVENFNFDYKATSPSVRSASLQIIAPANSGITAYLDNAQWFPLTATTPAPTPTNMITNGTFDAGITSGWTTDDAANITLDTANHGSSANPVNSVAIKSTTKNTHLFSPKITVDPTKSYNLISYVNLLQVAGGGEVGFFVDEYDSTGNWVSGQYKTGVRGVSAGDVNLTYKPTSATVKTASLQIIVTANSSINAYFDDVRWYLIS